MRLVSFIEVAIRTLTVTQKEYHTIAEYHDFVVRVIEYEVIKTVHGDGENVEEVYESKPKKVDEFKVQRDVLVGACDFFRKALQGGEYLSSAS